MSELEKLINKYKLKLDLKETEQKVVQTKAKNYTNKFEYKDEQNKMNIKINLVKLGTEIKMMTKLLEELKELQQYYEILEKADDKEC